MPAPAATDPHRAVRRWLAFLCQLILAMIVLGGVTRLTQSGLSMVTWEPLLGAVPPLNDQQWEERFAQYRQSPEFIKLNNGMTMTEFRNIFWWEFSHRLVGRLVGVVFLLPYLWFLIRRRVRGALAWKLGVAFLLGGLQGALGWFMVKSGLVDNPRVSHFRLAAHLSLALLLLSWLYWIYLDLRPAAPSSAGPRRLRWAALAFLAVLIVQIVYGAFVAGLDAGLVCNTFPKMFGCWIPPGSFAFAGQGLSELVNNPVTVQFIHRALGMLLGLGACVLWWGGRKGGLADRQQEMLRQVFGFTALQFTLGVVTLILYVPITAAAWHQFNGALLLLVTVGLTHALRGSGARKETPAVAL